MSWNKKNKAEIAVNIQSCIRLSTLLSAWFVRKKKKKERKKERRKERKKERNIGVEYLFFFAGLHLSSLRLQNFKIEVKKIHFIS